MSAAKIRGSGDFGPPSVVSGKAGSPAAIFTLLAMLLGAMLSDISPADAAESLPRLYTNQGYAEEVKGTSALAIGDPMEVFAFVLGSLPARVKVYPTENYYYFYFNDRHVRWAGNLRLDAVDRDEGKLHFAYYEDLAEWREQDTLRYEVLDGSRGVEVEKLAPLLYRVSYGGKNVIFELNDLSKVRPPEGTLAPDEVFLGPIFDESAMRFFLVFDRQLKVFHYILDETVEVADQFLDSEDTDRIVIGKRTGFAFYRDERLNRKILIGVFQGNSRVNNYFDGPFDQLPDNFLVGDTLRDAILMAEPQLTGQIDRFGIWPGGSDRYLIAPYRHYRYADDLRIFHTCATNKRIPAANYYACFVYDEVSNTLQAESRVLGKRNNRSARKNPGIKHR
jgi:hypothetical protein